MEIAPLGNNLQQAGQNIMTPLRSLPHVPNINHLQSQPFNPMPYQNYSFPHPQYNQQNFNAP